LEWTVRVTNRDRIHEVDIQYSCLYHVHDEIKSSRIDSKMGLHPDLLSHFSDFLFFADVARSVLKIRVKFDVKKGPQSQ
jgi:hypothetical protein